MERKTMYARVLEIKKTGHSKACNPHHYIDIEDARNFINDLEGKQAQGRCLGNEL